MLKVSRLPSGGPEIFRTIQGEGVSAGLPAAFVRLSTCNLSCTWCDTRYTWDWQSYDFRREAVTLSVDEVEKRVLALDQSRLVITGGEPMLQQGELALLVSSVAQKGVVCEVETNGTIVPLPEMAAAVAQWNVSPKLANSGNSRERSEVSAALEAFAALENAYFKFVVVEPSDVDEVSEMIERRGIRHDRVILMPEGVTAEVLEERGPWVAQACQERGFRFSTRLHILLWGDQRGR